MSNVIQVYRGLETAGVPVLLEGQPGFSTDTHQFRIGDGTNNHEVLMHHQFGANAIMVADSDDTPISKTIAERYVVGRLTGGLLTGIRIGTADNDIVQVSGTPSIEGFAQFDTVSEGGLKGLTGAESMAALSAKAAAHFSMNSMLLRDGITPLLPNDYTIKEYVDNLAEGIGAKFVARVRAQGDVPTLSGFVTVDGEVMADGDYVLCDQQTATTEDGMYVVRSGAWERPTGWEVGDTVGGYYVFIKEGTDDDNGYICTNDNGVDIVGTDDLVFVQFSNAGGGANKQLSNLEGTVAVNLSLIPGSAGKDLGSGALPWDDLYLKNGGKIDFNNGSAQIVHAGGTQIALAGGNIDLLLTGYIGRDADNNLGWTTDNRLNVVINGTSDSFQGIARGSSDTGSNEYLVTKNYVDDEITGVDPGLGNAHDFFKMNAAGTAREWVAVIDGGTW